MNRARRGWRWRVSELLVLEVMLRIARERPVMALADVYREVDPAVAAPYVGDVNSLKAMLFRLDQEGVMKARVERDLVVVDQLGDEDTHVHRLIRKLRETCELARHLHDFTMRVFTSELNRYFLDEREIRDVYEHLKRQHLQDMTT